MREYTEYWPCCQNCETRFMSTRQDAKYCSAKCRTAAHRARQKPKLNMALDPRQREDYYLVKDLSQRAARTITMIYDRHGLEAAQLAILAAIQAYENQMFAEE